MSTTPQLLDRLASLTSIRDIELLEFSLLKTLHELFRPEQLILLKLDNVGKHRHTLRYGSDGHHESSMTRAQRSESPEVESALRMSQRLGGAYHSKLANGNNISAYPVLDMQSMNVCLVIESRRPGSPQDARLIQGMLQIYRNFCLLIDDAQRDQLTGLLNRKTFDESIQRVIGLVGFHELPPAVPGDRRSYPERDLGAGHWLGIIDIDHFKRINDSFGHIYGDEVLLLVAQMMRESFRENDLLFRFGGEEFVVIAECPDMEGARMAFERFRQRIEKHHFPQIGRVTISFGGVQVHKDALVHSLLDQADQAMYYAKANGRNRVCFYEDLVAKGEIVPVQYNTGDVEFF